MNFFKFSLFGLIFKAIFHLDLTYIYRFHSLFLLWYPFRTYLPHTAVHLWDCRHWWAGLPLLECPFCQPCTRKQSNSRPFQKPPPSGAVISPKRRNLQSFSERKSFYFIFIINTHDWFPCECACILRGNGLLSFFYSLASSSIVSE